MKLDLLHWETRLLIQACQELELRWTGIIYTTKDEDLQAECSSDLGDLKIVKDALIKRAIEEFGPAIIGGPNESDS